MENDVFITQLVLTLVTILAWILINGLVRHESRKVRDKYGLSITRYYMIRRLSTISINLAALIILLVIWGIHVKNLWVSITSVMAMVAVAFFAVWSLIGNILAGILIYFTNPFKIGDYIEVAPDKIEGRVLAINTFFTVLKDEMDESVVSVPNTIFFQKYIKKVNVEKRKALKAEAEAKEKAEQAAKEKSD